MLSKYKHILTFRLQPKPYWVFCQYPAVKAYILARQECWLNANASDWNAAVIDSNPASPQSTVISVASWLGCHLRWHTTTYVPPRAGTGANTQNRYSLGIKMQLRLLLAANLYSDLVMLLLLIMTIICFVCFLCRFVCFCMLWKRELSVEIFRIGNSISQWYDLSEIIFSSLLKRKVVLIKTAGPA
jgi:hypothetical protein